MLKRRLMTDHKLMPEQYFSASSTANRHRAGSTPLDDQVD
jgi:hypothetical protein